jgi:hypothetical protein
MKGLLRGAAVGAVLAVALGGCVIAPAPPPPAYSYSPGYGPAPGYGYAPSYGYAPGYGYAPSYGYYYPPPVEVGVGFGFGERRHWR